MTIRTGTRTSSRPWRVSARAIQNLIHIFGGSDLLNAIVLKDIRVISLKSLSETQKCALTIPVPDLERFNPKPAFGGTVRRTPGVWCMARLCRQLPPFSLKVLLDPQIGNVMPILPSPNFRHSASSALVNKSAGMTLRSLIGPKRTCWTGATAHFDRWHLQGLRTACLASSWRK